MIVAPLESQGSDSSRVESQPSGFPRIESQPLDSSQIESKRFSFRAAKELVRDLHRPNPKIYWFDFLTSIIAGHALFTINVRSDLWLPHAAHAMGIVPGTLSNTATEIAFKGLILAATTLLFLRAAMFTHELVHLPRDGWQAFRFTWNLLCGIPFLIPSFTYYPHIDHHRRKSYGTEEDGEYLNLSHRPPTAIVLYMLGVLVTPFAGLIRFGILSPICWLYPAARKWTFRHASTMVMDITYQRPEASDRVYRIMLIQEAACFAVCLYLLLHPLLIAKTIYDPLLIHAYAVSVALIFMNNVRTLGSHRWTGPGSELTFEQQLLDSCDYPHRPWITELWGPTGTRYHATHHLFPSLPYHNLGKAHRRLIAGLPSDSLFHETVRVSLSEEIQALWKRSSLVQRSQNKPLPLPQATADYERTTPSGEADNDMRRKTSTASSHRAA